MISLPEEHFGLWARHYRAPLRAVSVTAVVQTGYAAVAWRQRYYNGESRPIEAVYTMPLPAGAALTRLSVEAGGRRLEGEVHPREEAIQAYEEALSAGHGVALLEQERDEVATVTVGSILPGEEVTVEIEFIEPLPSCEGALRWRLPTRVAPRYIPGVSTGIREGSGIVASTDRVPDADRISPPETPWNETTFELSLLVDLGVPVQIDSPSHDLRLEKLGGEARRVSLAWRNEWLDRDLVVNMQLDATSGVGTTLTAHRADDGPGVFALTLVPDLAFRLQEKPRSVALVLDVSGSMAGPSLERAVAAARLCLRHLRTGDLFLLLAFNYEVQRMDGYGLRVFDDTSLRKADRWLRGLRAEGGTELKAPLVEALSQVGDGLVFLLTDGQVANEAEIFMAARATGATARVYGFGVGTNVCEGLLRDLARASGGAVELIYPGESIDEKVLTQFARATAPRIEHPELILDGVEVDGLVPSALPPIIDGTPWCLLGRYLRPGAGRGLLVGLLEGEPFELEFSFIFPEREERPALARVWARERIRELEKAPEHDEDTRWQIIELATRYGLATRYTSLLVVEKREGDRLATAPPERRVVEVQGAPAFLLRPARRRRRLHQPSSPALPVTYVFRKGAGGAPASPSYSAMDFMRREDAFEPELARGISFEPEMERGITLPPPLPPPSPAQEILQAQSASGLWPGATEEEQAQASVQALERLHALGLTTDHSIYGKPIQKSIQALLAMLERLSEETRRRLIEVALQIAVGRRTRDAIQQAQAMLT